MSVSVDRINTNRGAVPGIQRDGTAGRSFSAVLEKVANEQSIKDFLGGKVAGELSALTERLKRGEVFKPSVLLSYQIKAGELGLKMELLSKLSDALVSIPRKLQNQT